VGTSCSGYHAGVGLDGQEVFSVEAVNFRTFVKRGFGWKPDLPDFRDYIVSANPDQGAKTVLPSLCDLRPRDNFAIYNQGRLGSCTANAIGAAVHYDQVQQGLVTFTPSRLFIYYNERALEGTIDEDAGAQIRDGMKTLNNLGVCSEEAWPYDTETFTQRPTDACYKLAAQNTAKEYARVEQNLNDIKTVLNNGNVIAFGFIVCSSFMTPEVAKTGKMDMPHPTDKIFGGHAVLCCGYDDARQVFTVRNSWGSAWGDDGYFYMPYDYMCDTFLSRDLWTLVSVTGGSLKVNKKRTFS